MLILRGAARRVRLLLAAATLSVLIWPGGAAGQTHRFVIISDLHPHPTAFDQLASLTEQVIGLKPAFAVVLGDIGGDQVPGPSDQEIKAIGEAFNRMRAAGIDVYSVMGNHDVYPRVEDIKTRWFCSQTPLPLNDLFDASRKTDAYRAFMNKGPYDYSFNRGGIHLVVLDSNCLPPKPSWDADRIKLETPRWEAHHKWMVDDLCRHTNNPARLPSLVFLHHPEYMTGDRRMEARPLYRVLENCRDGHTVKAVFGGHWHYGQNFPAENNLGLQVYATPASVVPEKSPIEFIVADVHPEQITFQARDSVTGQVRTNDEPVRYFPIEGRFSDLAASGKAPSATQKAAAGRE